MHFKHSVFTLMTPEYDLSEIVKLLAKLGYDGIEWRVHHAPVQPDGPLDYWRSNKATVDVDTILEKASEIRKMTNDQGLEIMALGTYLNYGMVDEVERCMESAAIMGAGSIRVGSPQYDGSENYNDLLDQATEGYVRIEELAKQYGVRATVEIHHGSICSSSSLAYMLVSNFDPDHIGVIFDPGNMVYEGMENWQLGLELLGPYISHIHVKNAAWSCESCADGGSTWKTQTVPLREGCVSWPSVVQALHAVGYNGWLSLEDFSPGDTKAKLADGLAYMKKLETDLGV